MAVRRKRMTYDEIVQLLELYRDNELLWNHGHDHYKNKRKRLEAFESIRIETDDETIDEVKRKLKVIRDTYNIERNKMVESRKSGVAAGDVYTTKLPWFHIANEFLSLGEAREFGKNVDDKPRNKSEIMEHSEIKLEAACLQQYDSQSSSESMADPLLEPGEVHTRKSANNGPRSCSKRIADSSHLARKRMRSSVQSSSGGVVPPYPRRPPLNEHVLEAFQSAVPHQLVQDEFQYFGLNMAAQLRELPMLRALILQEKLQKLVSQERIEYERSKFPAQNVASQTGGRSQDDGIGAGIIGNSEQADQTLGFGGAFS